MLVEGSCPMMETEALASEFNTPRWLQFLPQSHQNFCLSSEVVKLASEKQMWVGLFLSLF